MGMISRRAVQFDHFLAEKEEFRNYCVTKVLSGKQEKGGLVHSDFTMCIG